MDVPDYCYCAGNYADDSKAASQKGFGQNPPPMLNGEEYVWHHLDDYDPSLIRAQCN